MRLAATKNDFDMTIGIHTTCSEVKFYFIFKFLYKYILEFNDIISNEIIG